MNSNYNWAQLKESNGLNGPVHSYKNIQHGNQPGLPFPLPLAFGRIWMTLNILFTHFFTQQLLLNAYFVPFC